EQCSRKRIRGWWWSRPWGRGGRTGRGEIALRTRSSPAESNREFVSSSHPCGHISLGDPLQPGVPRGGHPLTPACGEEVGRPSLRASLEERARGNIGCGTTAAMVLIRP
uniref:Uncharacterized protein n=2 Tax=Aegilops tauschii subsp. strangulata TaxID=200361 RepID=A0A453S237_AEGTS